MSRFSSRPYDTPNYYNKSKVNSGSKYDTLTKRNKTCIIIIRRLHQGALKEVYLKYTTITMLNR